MTVIMRIPGTRPARHAAATHLGLPMIVRDIEPYESPIDGKMITSRSERREDLKRNGCVEWDRDSKRFEAGYQNPKFAAKRGLPLNEKGLAALEKQKKK